MSYTQTYPVYRNLTAGRGDTAAFTFDHEFSADDVLDIRVYVRSSLGLTSRIVMAMDTSHTPDNFVVADDSVTWIVLPADSQNAYAGTHWYDVELLIRNPQTYDTSLPTQIETAVVTIALGAFELAGDVSAADDIRYLVDTPNITQPQTGFGATGPYSTQSETDVNSAWPDDSVVTTFFPYDEVAGTRLTGRPIVFFAHGYYATDPASYIGLIEHLVSWGYVVVHVSYNVQAVSEADILDNYDMLTDGFEQAAAQYAANVDTTRVAYIGHSFGAGAAPALAWRGLVGLMWGTNGSALMAMAPWYAWNITDGKFAQLPATMRSIVQVYEAEIQNDVRMAIDIYEHLPGLAATKDYIQVNSDANQWRTMAADHKTPGSPRYNQNNLDFRGIWRLAVALLKYAFEGSATGAAIALGHGSPTQVDMGDWDDGTAFTELESWFGSDQPTPDESTYENPWPGNGLIDNPRYGDGWDAGDDPRPPAP